MLCSPRSVRREPLWEEDTGRLLTEDGWSGGGSRYSVDGGGSQRGLGEGGSLQVLDGDEDPARYPAPPQHPPPHNMPLIVWRGQAGEPGGRDTRSITSQRVPNTHPPSLLPRSHDFQPLPHPWTAQTSTASTDTQTEMTTRHTHTFPLHHKLQ